MRTHTEVESDSVIECVPKPEALQVSAGRRTTGRVRRRAMPDRLANGWLSGVIGY